MSIQWTLIACCLYVEIAIVVLFMLPIASAKSWTRLFRSRLFYYFQTHVAIYFTVTLSLMALLLLDAIREMRKYSTSGESPVHLTSELKGHVKLFRAQRNFYITGFSIFLVFVIRRFITMLIMQADLVEKSMQMMRQASEVARNATERIVSEAEHNRRQSDTEIQNQVSEQIKLHEQTCNAQKQMISDMTAEIQEWRCKYEELVRKHDAGDH